MPHVDTSADVERPAGSSKEWNFHPDLPISMSPVFDVPPKPKAAAVWLFGTWLKLTPPVSHLFFALIATFFLLPSITEMQNIQWGWILRITSINLLSVLLLAGSLHFYLHVLSAQKLRLKFDIRPMEKSARFTFGNQVWDNVFWTLASGVPIWSGWMVLYFYVAANNWIPSLQTFSSSPIWFVLLFFIIRFWQSLHFYCIHRLIHYPWIYKNIHYLHHRNINVGPWSGLSMHPAEHILYYSGILIHFALPSHPLHVLFHMFSLNLGAVYTHSGFDKLIVKNVETIKAGSFHHQLHHRYFECNYGSEEIPIDRWFRSFHDGTPAANQHIRERKKRLVSKK